MKYGIEAEMIVEEETEHKIQFNIMYQYRYVGGRATNLCQLSYKCVKNAETHLEIRITKDNVKSR